MSSITLNQQTQVLTKQRGWQFLLDLQLNDEIQCISFPADQQTLEQTPQNVEKIWCLIENLERHHIYQTMWIRSTNFEFVYDECRPLLHKTVSKEADKDCKQDDIDGNWHPKFWSCPNTTCTIDDSSLNYCLEESKDSIWVWDENLNPFQLNSAENIKNFHSGEHKIYSWMISFSWRTKTSKTISIPLTKQGAKIRDYDNIENSQPMYLFVPQPRPYICLKCFQ